MVAFLEGKSVLIAFNNIFYEPIFPNIFNQVLINFDSAGRPYFAIQKGLELVNLSNYLVSISHSKYSAIAVVIRLI